MNLVISVQDYLNRPLIALVKHLYGEDVPIITVRANRHINKWFVFKLFFYLLPFRLERIFTPSDLGGRMVRVLVDLAYLFGVEVIVVPAHNHVWHCDPPLPLYLRYIDLHALKVPGAFARHAKIVMNDEKMRDFFLSLGYNPRRLVMVPNWIQLAFKRTEPMTYPVVFFSEVMQEIDEGLRDSVIRRIRRLLDECIIDHLYVKLHPREPVAVETLYRELFGQYASVTFLSSEVDSTTVINRAGVVMACISTGLLEAIWLGRRVIVFDNSRYTDTMLRFYLDGEHFFVYGEETAGDAVREFFQRALNQVRSEA